MTDLKALLGARLLTVIQESRDRPSDYLVCVCDDYTTRILSSCLRVHAINDAGIGAVVNIRFPRESLPSTPVMYLMHPNADNWKFLLDDFKKQPKYGYVYLYTTAPVAPDLMQMLQGSPILARLKAFKEVNVDFLSIESRVFSFGRAAAMPHLYFRSVAGSVRSEELRRTADQLCSLCVTLNEYPYIRYVAANSVTSEIAHLVEKSLENALRSLKNWKFNANRATLLILDRSIDCVAPLMHEYTYQAMVNDILTVNGEICRLKPTGKETADDKKKSADSDQFVLSEDDSLWRDLRHKHIGEALPTVNALFNDFRKKNAVANLDDGASLKDLLKAAKHATSFRSEMQRFTKHMSILENAFDHFDKMGLKKLGEVEQDMVTGVTEEGKKTNKTDLMNSLVAVIEDQTISPIDKLRLIMIYIIAQDGIKEATRKKLFSVAKLSDRHVDAVQNLFYLGVKLQTNRKSSGANLSSATIKKNAAIAKASQLALMRFIPKIYELIENLVEGSLDRQAYPFLKEPPDVDQQAKGASSARSARSKPAAAPKANKWRNRGGDSHYDGTDSSNTGSSAVQKQIVFMAGGVTFSEMRAAYEVAGNTGADIILGSSSTLTPAQFLDDMMSAHSAAADIEINLDD